VSVDRWRVTVALLAGLALALYSFWMLGDSMLGRYANLILLRSNDPSVERTALNANAFSLTQSWSWLSIIAIFCFLDSKWRRILVLASC
jgi:hypothetical protein